MLIVNHLLPVHWGETKTWYGIPGEDADKFEAAIKAEAPDLFEQQPSLLFQLITLMNPGRVKKAGVRVYACDQRANEFVITFPKAYHSGFNQGVSRSSSLESLLSFTDALSLVPPSSTTTRLSTLRDLIGSSSEGSAFRTVSIRYLNSCEVVPSPLC